MTCLQPPAPSLEAIASSIDTCAVAFGGADWTSKAGLGLVAFIVIVALLASLAWWTWRFGR